MALPLIGFFTGGLFAKVLAFVLASAFLRIATAIGFTVVTYTGIDLIFTEITDFVEDNLTGITSYSMDILEMFGFIFFINTILATAAAVLAIKSLGSLKKMVIK